MRKVLVRPAGSARERDERSVVAARHGVDRDHGMPGDGAVDVRVDARWVIELPRAAAGSKVDGEDEQLTRRIAVVAVRDLDEREHPVRAVNEALCRQ
jgi:hypothetical protein